jgi:hydrogenase-4 component B
MQILFILLLSIFLVGAGLSFILQKNADLSHKASSISAIIGSIMGIGMAIDLLLTKSFFSFIIPTSFPLFNISVHVDALSAFFILIISLVALASSVYGIGYMRHYYSIYNIGMFGFFYNLFILSLMLVTTAYNGFYFIFVWELMSLSSLFLVVFEHKLERNVKSGYIYFAMTHIATAFIFSAFFLLYQITGTFDFGAIKQISGSILPLLKDCIFLLLLIGFGTKAGIIPLHIWLPRAHSASPSHVSALMSGVMIKMGIFMMFRFFVDLLPHAPLWWGATILVVGALSSVLGVLYALSEHDSKRLLAYHSIENIGIILLGLGSGIIFASLGNSALATVAFMAALFHTLNHAVFKALLFLGAGSVISQTHTRNIEEYGGLIKNMPYTSLFFLIGALAISGLPPFNGFVSEWLTFQSLFGGIVSQSVLIKSLFIFAGGSLALTGGLAAACFVKAFGMTFLARPRSSHAQHAKESSSYMTSSMGYLAALCLILGVFSFAVLPLLRDIVTQLTLPGALSDGIAINGMTVQINNGFAIIVMPLLFILVCFSIIFAWFLTNVLSNKQKVKTGEIWDCGYNSITPRMEITATGFSRSIIMIFKGIFQPSMQHDVEYVDADIRYFSKSRTVTLGIVDIYEKYFYHPFDRLLNKLSLQVRRIQAGNINAYILYIIIILLGLIIWTRYR